MDFERYTDRAKGFVQAAQNLALRDGHQQFAPEHLLKVLLDDPEGLCRRADRPRRRPLARGTGGRRARARQAAQGFGRRRRPDLPLARARAPLRQRAEDRREGRRQVRDRRAASARARAREGSEAARILAEAGVTPENAQRRHQRDQEGPHRRQRVGRAGLRRAEALRARSDGGRGARQARSRDRPRRGDPPHHPGALPAHQEQSRADRRARRRQDGDRRGPRAAHHQGRRAGEPQGQEAARARHGRADRGRQVSAASSRSA